MITHTRQNQGTCSVRTTVEIEDGTIKSLEIEDGCNGNLQGIAALVVGQNAAESAARLKGIQCGSRPTSCPDQIAKCIEEALAKA